jgi:GNAT superfamily N-acetyltransferase
MVSDQPAAAPDVCIREAVEADLPRLMDLLFDLSQLGELPAEAVTPAGEAERAALRALQDDSRFSCLVLEVGGRVEGTLTLYVLPNLSHGGRPAAIVENVVVDSRLRGRGYGRMLVERAETIAREQGCYKVSLTSNRRRIDAHRFYERIGYNPSHQGFTKYRGED